jgi:hypothetical protein
MPRAHRPRRQAAGSEVSVSAQHAARSVVAVRVNQRTVPQEEAQREVSTRWVALSQHRRCCARVGGPGSRLGSLQRPRFCGRTSRVVPNEASPSKPLCVLGTLRMSWRRHGLRLRYATALESLLCRRDGLSRFDVERRLTLNSRNRGSRLRTQCRCYPTDFALLGGGIWQAYKLIWSGAVLFAQPTHHVPAAPPW